MLILHNFFCHCMEIVAVMVVEIIKMLQKHMDLDIN